MPTQPKEKPAIHCSQSNLYRLERAGKFPARIRMGQNRVAWRLAEVEKWLTDRPTVHPARADTESEPDSIA